MFRYSGFGLTIHSELELPDLPPGGPDPDVAISFGKVPTTKRTVTLQEEFAVNSHAGTFHIRHGREIVMDPRPDVDYELLRIVLLGRMMAFLMRQRGWLSLHASGVAMDRGVALFLGASGSGKSTTAAAFHSRGHRVITDDVGAVKIIGQQCLVRGSGARIRLLDDSRKAFGAADPPGVFRWDKHTFDLSGESDGEVPVRVVCIYLLEYGEEFHLERLPPAHSVISLSGNSFVKRWRMDRASLQAHLRACTDVAGIVPVRRVIRPRALDALPELVRRIEGDCKSL
jgi:hypothetical protein